MARITECKSVKPRGRLLNSLAVPTNMRASATYNKFMDWLAAGRARITLAAVHLKLLLEHPHLALAVDVRFDRRTAGVDRFLQRCDDRLVQPSPFPGVKRIRLAFRMNACTKQRL
ncbi:MAG: hypothetical protein K0R75_2781, partial [Paenibacillaceae bacterium]|nr:hypothetical protein [Paenibacillaceae bacterium]